MFLLGMLIGSMVGGTLAIVLYACIIVGKESDEHCEQ